MKQNKYILLIFAIFSIVLFCFSFWAPTPSPPLTSINSELKPITYTQQYRYFVSIKTTPGHIEDRKKIRDSWLRYFTDPSSVPLTASEKKQFSYKFFLGRLKESNNEICRPGRGGEACKMSPSELEKELQIEQSLYGDIVRLDVVEDYWNLTEKLGETLIYSYSHFAFDYYVGIDDDTFPRIDLVFQELQKRKPHKLYFGRFHKEVPSIDKYDDYPMKVYPPYATGLLFALSHDLVEYVVNNFKYLDKLMPDDCALGLWLLPLKVKEVDFYYRFIFNEASMTCTSLARHKPNDLKTLYIISQNGMLCKGDDFWLGCSSAYEGKIISASCKNGMLIDRIQISRLIPEDIPHFDCEFLNSTLAPYDQDLDNCVKQCKNLGDSCLGLETCTTNVDFSLCNEGKLPLKCSRFRKVGQLRVHCSRAPQSYLGSALSFETKEDMVVIPDHKSLRLNSNFTICFWFKPHTTPSDWIRLIGKGSPEARNFGMFTTHDMFTMQQFHTDSSYYSVWSTKKFSLNEWHFICGVRNDQNVRLYLNGEECGNYEVSMGTPHTSADPLTIGRDPHHEWMNHKMDEVRIWDYPKSEGEIKQDMITTPRERIRNEYSYSLSEKQRKERGLIGYWSFDELGLVKQGETDYLKVYNWASNNDISDGEIKGAPLIVPSTLASITTPKYRPDKLNFEID
eukprot:TRINITY_DN3747_c0_g2_i1.p1 TRINITY_DN3747_c0_g2~~TRINITY_DN3747_c0_g2_i1.p1  ORF type:complete len:679 (-),score=120.08 TRINITY_DN3747_c0_g2_i1:216-2252(-)